MGFGDVQTTSSDSFSVRSMSESSSLLFCSLLSVLICEACIRLRAFLYCEKGTTVNTPCLLD